MILSSDELEILEYLKSWNGTYVSMVEICRCAGGRRKFKENPNWAKCMMSRLVEGHLVDVNDRGHYRISPERDSAKVGENSLIVGDNYFPAEEAPNIVGDNYFSPSETTEAPPERWISPHIETILKKAGKKVGKPKANR